jgi:Glutathione peroxidase
MSVYDYSVAAPGGEKISLRDYAGKVLLIINSATECGFTPQYGELQDIYGKYQAKGLAILDFPCNQFGNQAPGTDEEIHAFCDTRYGITFPVFSKISVNGEHAEPLFTFLKSQKGFGGLDEEHPYAAMMKDLFAKNDPGYAGNPDIKWNFTKFLIGRDGTVVARFEPTHDMADVEKQIAALL